MLNFTCPNLKPVLISYSHCQHLPMNLYCARGCVARWLCTVCLGTKSYIQYFQVSNSMPSRHRLSNYLVESETKQQNYNMCQNWNESPSGKIQNTHLVVPRPFCQVPKISSPTKQRVPLRRPTTCLEIAWQQKANSYTHHYQKGFVSKLTSHVLHISHMPGNINVSDT